MPGLPLIRIATRGSALALAQSNLVATQLRAGARVKVELKIIKTTGDKLQTASLANAGLPKGLFTKELEVALLEREADLAVHSLKDLPTELPAGLILGAVSRREDVRDVVVCRRELALGDSSQGSILDRLPRQATIATSSTRRAAQLLEARKDLKLIPIRGNVGTRLRKVAESPVLHATILAAAGLKRLWMTIDADATLRGPDVPQGLCAHPIPSDIMLPCVGQAALGIEIRAGDTAVQGACRVLNDADTHTCVIAERAFLRGMGGGCQLAVAALGEVVDGRLRLRAVSFLGGQVRRAEGSRPRAEAEELGFELARQLAVG